jgi:N-acetylmuramic acid 6-phosphate etherase
MIEPPGIESRDVVMGIATGSTTPYVRGALAHAKAKGCKTIFFCCTHEEDVPNPENIDVLINPIVGPEVVTGSTRMKAGTATKLVLNMITTTAMIQMGKTYGNIMVDLRATNEKLVDRSIRIVRTLADVDRDAAEAALETADWRVKTALIMILADCSRDEAERFLGECDGFTRRAVERIRAQRDGATADPVNT